MVFVSKGVRKMVTYEQFKNSIATPSEKIDFLVKIGFCTWCETYRYEPKFMKRNGDWYIASFANAFTWTKITKYFYEVTHEEALKVFFQDYNNYMEVKEEPKEVKRACEEFLAII